MRDGRPNALDFLGWTVAGAGICLATLTGFTIGGFVILGALVLVAGLLTCHGSRNHSATGLVSGAGLVLLSVGYLNRGGPGEVCTSRASEHDCIDELSQWPWIAVGSVLVTVGLAALLRPGRAR